MFRAAGTKQSNYDIKIFDSDNAYYEIGRRVIF